MQSSENSSMQLFKELDMQLLEDLNMFIFKNLFKNLCDSYLHVIEQENNERVFNFTAQQIESVR